MKYFFYRIPDIDPTSLHDDEHIASLFREMKVFSRMSGFRLDPIIVDQIFSFESREKGIDCSFGNNDIATFEFLDDLSTIYVSFLNNSEYEIFEYTFSHLCCKFFHGKCILLCNTKYIVIFFLSRFFWRIREIPLFLEKYTFYTWKSRALFFEVIFFWLVSFVS